MKRYAFLNILEHWNLECYVMGSLLIQIILVFIAPMRRWSNNGLMHVVIWLVYLMAIFFSTFALSLIYYHDAAKEKKEYAVYPLWAPFLLVHLGGPHTITALSVEDNNLWHRHVLTIVVQGCSVLVVLYQYRILDSEWLLPTAIVFLVGIVKCFERIFSLQFASPDFVRWSMLERARNLGNKTTRMVSGLDEELEIVRRGYELYQTFKGFIIDHTFIINKDERGTTEMEWFRKLKDDKQVKVAFKVMEMELYFMYEGMFTKMVAVEYWKDNYFWCIWRFVCHALLITVTVIFFCHSKHQLHPSVIGITYCLLGCALLLDQLALLNLIFSHWTIVKIMNYSCYKATASEEKGKATASEVVSNIILPVIHCGVKLFVNKRWSGKIIQYSLVRHSRGRLKWAELKPEFYYLREAIDSCLYTETAEVEDRLKELVFKYIQRVANSHQQQQQQKEEEDLYHGNMDDYATCVLILHVATEICYHLTAADDEEEEKKAKFCIQISQYLAYLLVLEGNITSTLPGSIGMRFKDICQEQVNYTFDHLHSTFNPLDKGRWCRKRMSIKQACQNLINEEWEKRRNKTDVEQQRECEDSCLTKENKYSSCNDEQLEDNNQKEKRTITEDVEQPRACEDPCLTKENKYSSCNDEQLKDNHEKPVLLKAAVDLAAAMIIQIDPKAGNDKQQQQKDLEAGNNEEQQQRSKVFWEGLSEVWVGLLVYASTHCRGDVYYLNRGGQFYTFVRLLMAHFGLQQSLKFERSFQFHNEICTNLSKPSFQLYHDICTNLRLKPTISGK